MASMRFAQLVSITSLPRIGKYYQFLNQDKRKTVQAYFLNVDLSAELFKLFSLFEIAFRNNIDHQISTVLPFSVNWPQEIAQGKLNKSAGFLSTRKVISEAIKLSKDQSHNQIICQLTFGFWCSLFSGLNFVVLGSRLIKSYYPTKKTDPKNLRKKLHQIRVVRNRIAHHEPIIFNKRNQISPKYIKTTLNNLLWLMNFIDIDTNQLQQFTKRLYKLIEKLEKMSI